MSCDQGVMWQSHFHSPRFVGCLCNRKAVFLFHEWYNSVGGIKLQRQSTAYCLLHIPDGHKIILQFTQCCETFHAQPALCCDWAISQSWGWWSPMMAYLKNFKRKTSPLLTVSTVSISLITYMYIPKYPYSFCWDNLMPVGSLSYLNYSWAEVQEN